MIPIAEQAALRGMGTPVGKTVGELRSDGFEIPPQVKDWLIFAEQHTTYTVDTHCFGKETGYVWDTPRAIDILQSVGIHIGMGFTELDELGWPLSPTVPRYFHVAAWKPNAPQGRSPFLAGLHQSDLVPAAIYQEIVRLRALTGIALEYTTKALRHWEVTPYPTNTSWERIAKLHMGLIATVIEGAPIFGKDAAEYTDLNLAHEVASRMLTEALIESDSASESDFEAGWR